MAVTPTALGETIVAGDDYVATVTLTKDGSTYDITGATVTCTLRPIRAKHNSLIDHAVTITSAASGIVTLTLTDTETGSLLWNEFYADYRTTYDFYADFKVVESGGNILHCGPFSVPVRRGIT